MYAPADVPVPERGWSEMENMLARLARFEDQRFRLDSSPKQANAIRKLGYEDPKGAFRRMWAGYWALCTQLDAAFGSSSRRWI